MSLSIGIVGLPNVGKSTLFNALTRAGVLASSYPFAIIGPNVGIVGVPDVRLAEAGLGEPGLDQLARAGFHALGVQTFLTAGPKETRAWTIRAGATAPEAAGVIHTDFQRGFIKAEIVSYDDLIAAGSLTAARAADKARIEGKDYVMRDGDVVEFRFNV